MHITAFHGCNMYKQQSIPRIITGYWIPKIWALQILADQFLSAFAPEAWLNLWQNGWQTPSLLDPKASFKPSPQDGSKAAMLLRIFSVPNNCC